MDPGNGDGSPTGERSPLNEVEALKLTEQKIKKSLDNIALRNSILLK